MSSEIFPGAPGPGTAVCFKIRSYIFERNDDARSEVGA